MPAGWPKRVHAWLLAHCTARYERMVAERKRTLLGDIPGDVLEIGPGAGPNLRYYPAGVRWIGIEPNPYMHPYLREAAERRGLGIEIRSATAEQIPAEDSSVDTVVSTLVLCSVRDPAATLREIVRVLRPGGRFVFLEHVAAPPGTKLRRMQNLLCPLWKVIADGCHPNRETGRTIEQAGFDRVHYEPFRLPLGPVGPQIAGFAIKRSAGGANPC
ncbi:MAG TPA: class I SAM-dependent methyltransferase [Gemmatimonadales bacterium]|nr:class I SAM-dependent methyltransferase [Gemmatimonadales bacterium]